MAWRPPSFLDFWKRINATPLQAAKDLDDAIQRTYAQVQDLQNQINGTKDGVTSVTGTATIATGLRSVTNVLASIDNGTTATNFWVTVAISATVGSIIVNVWKPTGVADTTPVAATTSVSVRWLARGSA
jgi:hypothetical protein